MPITLNPEYNPRLAKLDSKTMPQYKYAVYYKNNDSDLIRRKVFKTRKSAMDFLGQINFVKSHEGSTKESPLSIEEFKTYWYMSEILGKYTDVSISQIFEAYSKYSRDLQDNFDENIELAITNFFKFDVSVVTNISVCEARSIYLNTLNTSERSEAHKQHARLFTGYFLKFLPKDKLVNDLKKEDIYDWLVDFKNRSRARRGTTPANVSVYNAVHYVSVFLSFCYKKNFLKENPVKKMFLPEIRQREPQIYTLQQICSIINATEYGSIRRLFITLYFFTGIRLSELLRLKWRNLNLAQSGVFLDESIVKTDKRRFVKLPQNLADTLPSYFKIHNPNPDARIFKWQHHIAQRYLNEIFEAANVKRIRNGIRHTAASYHLAQSGSAFKSAEQLGNSARILKIHYTGNVTKKQCKQFYALDLTKPHVEVFLTD